MPARVYRVEAIVLKEMDYGEADRILTLLTPGGKVTALAKGIRRVTSRKAGQLGLFHRAELVMARGRNMEIISQAQSLETYEGLRQDLFRFTYASYAAELMDRFVQGEEEDSAVFYDLMAKGLEWLANQPDPRLWMRYFEIRLLALSGYQPQFHRCTVCGREVQPETNFFDMERGGIVCPRCVTEVPQARAVSLGAQKVLRYLLTRSPEEIRGLTLKPETQEEVEALLERYLEYTLERDLRSVAVLKRLRQEIREAQRTSSLPTEMAG